MIRPYEEIPESTRDYVDFIFNIADLGEDMGRLYEVERRRNELHEHMVADYGLRYEYTRAAVCYPYAELVKMRPERIAQIIDSNLRWIRDSEPKAHALKMEEGVE